MRSTPSAAHRLLMMAIVGMFTYEFSVVSCPSVRVHLRRGASGYAALTAAMGLGAVVGGLFTAGRRAASTRALVISSSLFGGSVLLVAVAPTLAWRSRQW